MSELKPGWSTYQQQKQTENCNNIKLCVTHVCLLTQQLKYSITSVFEKLLYKMVFTELSEVLNDKGFQETLQLYCSF
jgi:hypothetical protein